MTDFCVFVVRILPWVVWLPSADTFYIDCKMCRQPKGTLDERLKDSRLMLTMIEWCRSAANESGSPGRTRTSDLTVNRRWRQVFTGNIQYHRIRV
jgi:hypothetical protein